MTENCPHQGDFRFGRGSSDSEHQKHQADISTLLDNHHKITREIKLLDNGFIAITTSDDEQIAKVLKTHTSDMKTRFANGRAIRSWDAVYALLFAYRHEIEVNYEYLDNGIKSWVSTPNTQLVEALHAHAKAVSGFVSQGRTVSGESYPISNELLRLLDNKPYQD